jgi:hypothetical protein
MSEMKNDTYANKYKHNVTRLDFQFPVLIYCDPKSVSCQLLKFLSMKIFKLTISMDCGSMTHGTKNLKIYTRNADINYLCMQQALMWLPYPIMMFYLDPFQVLCHT